MSDVQELKCPICGNMITTEPSVGFIPLFCSKCGTSIKDEYQPDENYCPKCSPNGPSNPYESLELDDKFCPICGGKTVLYDYIISQDN